MFKETGRGQEINRWTKSFTGRDHLPLTHGEKKGLPDRVSGSVNRIKDTVSAVKDSTDSTKPLFKLKISPFKNYGENKKNLELRDAIYGEKRELKKNNPKLKEAIESLADNYCKDTETDDLLGFINGAMLGSLIYRNRPGSNETDADIVKDPKVQHAIQNGKFFFSDQPTFLAGVTSAPELYKKLEK